MQQSRQKVAEWNMQNFSDKMNAKVVLQDCTQDKNYKSFFFFFSSSFDAQVKSSFKFFTSWLGSNYVFL